MSDTPDRERNEPPPIFTRRPLLEWTSWGIFTVQFTWVGWFMFFSVGVSGSWLWIVGGTLLVSSLFQMTFSLSGVLWRPFPVQELANHPDYSFASPVSRILAGVSGFVASFAMFYWQAGQYDGHCFSEAMSKGDAAYFAFTTFTTTGFGDIHAVSSGCRALVTAQMASGVLILSVVLTIAVGRYLAIRS